MEKYNKIKHRVNNALKNLTLDKPPVKLYEPIKYIISLGGKRLRPVLLLAANEMFGGAEKAAMPAALGLEIFHNFTLLHDDIMDEAAFRRGQATVHKKWDSNIAILSGDTMFALAYQQFHSLSPLENFAEILQTFTNTAIEVCEGQQYDMDFETSEIVTIPQYVEMIRLKTAVLLGCSLKIGALTAGANTHQANLLYDFGVNIGQAFQLKDDYLDAFGDYEKFGKKIGGDIATNKKTYLYLKCLELANKNDREILIRNYQEANIESDKKIKDALGLFEKYDVKKHITVAMEKYFVLAVDLMKSVEASETNKTELLKYTEWLYKRDY